MSKIKTIPDITKCKNGPGCTCWELMCPPCSKEVANLTKAHIHQYEMAGLMLRRAEYLERVVENAPHHSSCSITTGVDRRCDCWKAKVLGG
jgi:hypothetical protein